MASTTDSGLARNARHVEADMLGADFRCDSFDDIPFLLVVQPGGPERSSRKFLTEWTQANMAMLEDLLIEFGAVLYRGFAIHGAEAFDEFCSIFPTFEMGYGAGVSPRQPIAGKVFESTRVPAPNKLIMHQEMSYMQRYPAKLAFHCHVAPDSGGETIIGDMRRFTAALPDPIMRKLDDKGVTYRRNYLAPGTDDARTEWKFAHPDWAFAFYTDDRDEIEAACRARGLDFEWRKDGSLSTAITLPGTVRHPVTGDMLFFNQLYAQTPHPRWMGKAMWEWFDKIYGDEWPLPIDATYGDGSPLEDDEFNAIYDGLDAVTRSFPWQPGDVLLLDNLLTGHGRNPYKGKRDVQVVLIG